jgi:two-component system NtrC family sensor kinase
MSETKPPDDAFEAQFHDALQGIAAARDPGAALDAITGGACRVFGVQYAIIWTFDGQDLVPAAWSGFSSEDVKALRFRLGSGLAGQVALADDLVEADLTTESKEVYRPLAKRHNLRLAVHVPLRYEGVTRGVMAIADAGPKRLTACQKRALRTFASYAAIALENAQLYSASHREEVLWRATFDGIGDPVWLVDPSGRVTRLNQAAVAALGRPAKDIVGRESWSAVLGLAAREAAPETACLAEGVPVAREFDVERLGGTFHVSASPVRDAASRVTGAVVVARDTTERRQLERQLADTEKLTAIGRLISGVAHELNNPLSSVMGFADLVAKNPGSPDVVGHLRIISDEASRAVKIVRNLLTFARATKPERSSCRLSELAGRVAMLMAYDLRTCNVQIIPEFPPDEPEVVVDPSQIQQLLVNLVSNAIYAIRDAGRPGRVWIRLARRGDRVLLTVEDDGPGLPATVLDRLFEPFMTTKPPGKGTGLGLSVCYGIVREHGGHIRGQNRPEGGASFVVELSLHDSDVQSTQNPQSRSETPRHLRYVRNLRILVVDDEPSIREFARACLGHANTVATLDDPRTALDLLRRSEFDVILCDVKMPGGDGRDFYAGLVRQNERYASRVIFMTGDLLGEETREFLDTFGLPSVEKPFQRRDLLKAIIQLLKLQG